MERPGKVWNGPEGRCQEMQGDATRGEGYNVARWGFLSPHLGAKHQTHLGKARRGMDWL